MSRTAVNWDSINPAEGAEGYLTPSYAYGYCPLFEMIRRNAATLRTLRRNAKPAGQSDYGPHRTLRNPPQCRRGAANRIEGTRMTTRQSTVQAALAAHPDLGANGFACGHTDATPQPGCRNLSCGQPREDADRDLAALRTADSATVIEAVAALLEPCRRTKAADGRSPGSYGLKHTAEQCLADDPVAHGYVSNGQLIAAALLCGFPVARYGAGSPNAAIGIHRGDVRRMLGAQ